MWMMIEYKRLISFVNGLGPGYDKFVHVNAGLAIWLCSMLVFRRSPGSILPLLVVFVAESANEIFDWSQSIEWGWRETALDFLATMIWPSVFAICFAISSRTSTLEQEAGARISGGDLE